MRAGLGASWRCLFANDIDPRKGASYVENWGDQGFHLGDVATLRVADLPRSADLAWASFPCQDLSLAGSGAGLGGKRSGTYWPFRDLMRDLAALGCGPRLIVLENVRGALTSHGGQDFVAISSSISEMGYRLGAMIVDASAFLPQSRPRLFVIALRDDIAIRPERVSSTADKAWSPPALLAAADQLPPPVRRKWVWWKLPKPLSRKQVLADVIDDEPKGIAWHSAEETTRLLRMMTVVNRTKVEQAKASGKRTVGTIYKRTRPDGSGGRVQRAEVRFDGIAGCLRTPCGGSSRQTVMLVCGDCVQSRLLSPRETARLMGLPDSYRLPKNYNDSYRLAGDGVAVPVVRYIAEYLLEPLLVDRSVAVREAA